MGASLGTYAGLRKVLNFLSLKDQTPCPAHTCNKPFSWRKKWKKVWDEVKYCSEKCRRNKSRKDFEK